MVLILVDIVLQLIDIILHYLTQFISTENHFPVRNCIILMQFYSALYNINKNI